MTLSYHPWAQDYIDDLLDRLGLDPNANQRHALGLVASETGTEPHFNKTPVYKALVEGKLGRVHSAIMVLADHRKEDPERHQWMLDAAAKWEEPMPHPDVPRPVPPKPAPVPGWWARWWMWLVAGAAALVALADRYWNAINPF